MNHGLVAESQAGRCIGYRQALNYLSEAWDFPEALKQGAPCQKVVIFYFLASCQLVRESTSYSVAYFLLKVDIKSELAHKQFVDFILHYQASTR